MDILDFQVNPITEQFKGVTITFNADAFTPDFFRNAAKRLREIEDKLKADLEENAIKTEAATDNMDKAALTFENYARRLEQDRDFYAVLLAGTPDVPVLISWDFTRKVLNETDGTVTEQPVPCTDTEIRRLKPKLVEEIYHWCVRTASPKSPETPTTEASPTISETTDAGSVSPDTQQAESQIM